MKLMSTTAVLFVLMALFSSIMDHGGTRPIVLALCAVVFAILSLHERG